MLEYNLEFIKKYKISIIIGMLMLFFCMSFYLFILNHKVKCNNVEEFVIISRGSSASSIGTLLQDNECFEDINIFKLALKIGVIMQKRFPIVSAYIRKHEGIHHIIIGINCCLTSNHHVLINVMLIDNQV